jgi:aminopeptidase N
MVYTMGEPLEGRYWFPTHDWPNERWTALVQVSVPARFSAVSNGVLDSKSVSDDGTRATFKWKNDVPTDPHLVGVVVGELETAESQWRGRPVRVYAHPRFMEAARYTFRKVPQMLDFYSELVGVDYPYPAYSHIVVVDHHHGGMEHAGFSFLDPTLLTNADESEGGAPMDHVELNYVAHMLAHQWFAGIANYKTVSEAWLNEGFGTYLHLLWSAEGQSPEYFEWQMNGIARRVADSDSSESGRPMVDRSMADAGDIYTADHGKIYVKGVGAAHAAEGVGGRNLLAGRCAIPGRPPLWKRGDGRPPPGLGKGLRAGLGAVLRTVGVRPGSAPPGR